MILRKASSAIASALATFCMVPAYADVLEINGDEARWIAGPHTGQNAGQNPQTTSVTSGSPTPLAELPQGAHAIADHAVSDIAQHSSGIPRKYAAKIAELSVRFDLSPALLEALVWQESRWHAGAVSPAGARGLAQLMPGTARYLGVDPDDPFANLEGGARYLREQLDRFDGNLEKALAAYNAGPGRVIRAGGVPRIRETQNYVAKIMGRLADHSRANFSGSSK